jgi:UDP-glucose 4-epimerase
MRVLVTGGGGFVGSHLADRHLARGDEVVVLDDFSTGVRANLRRDVDGLTVVEGRVETPGILDRAVPGVELIYHLAAAVGVFGILRNPLDSLRRNIDASEALFDRAAREGIRTVFTSTSEVYGKNGKAPLSEGDDSIYGPTTAHRWLYAVSKAADEHMALAHHREHGLPITIVRLFNTTGPRQSGAYGMVLPRFLQQALLNDPVTVYGNGSQTRCFTNVSDVVECLVRLGECADAIGEVVNIGQPTEISMLDLARLVVEVTGSSSKIVTIPYERAYEAGFEDMRRRVPDVAKLRRLIGYAPDTSLETTIRQMIAAQQGDDGDAAADGDTPVPATTAGAAAR